MFIIKPLIINDILKKMLYKHVHGDVTVTYVNNNNTNDENPIGFPANWKPKPCILPIEYHLKFANDIRNFEVRNDDIWIITFPKCGTTWTQEMVWLIVNELNIKGAKSVDLFHRVPFLEMSGIVSELPENTIEICNQLQSPRIIKTHLPVALLPKQLWQKKPKIIYVARNAKDCAVSYFHQYKYMVGFRGTKEDFLEAFLNDYVQYSPFFDHLLEFWQIKEKYNILFITYEEMKLNIRGIIKRTSSYLGRYYNDNDVDTIAEHISFESMKLNDSCNFANIVKIALESNGLQDANFNFIRKGEMGSYREELTEQYIKRFDEWTTESLKNSDFRFLI